MTPINRRTRWGYWIVVGISILIVLTLIKLAYNTYLFNFKGELEHISRSPREAIEKGTFVCDLKPDIPDGHLLTTNGQPVGVSAWVEERHQETHRLVWFPSVDRLGGATVSVSTETDQKVVVSFPSFSGSSGRSSSGGHTLFYHALSNWDNSPIRVRIALASSAQVWKEFTLIPVR